MNLLEINSWWDYLLYILKRNKGYGYRKLLNSFNLLAEVSCYSWLFNGALLKDFLIVPLFFILFSFVLDQVIFMARVSPDFSIKKIRTAILSIIIMLLGLSIAYVIKDPSSKNILLGSIFCLKLFGVTTQTMISLNVVKYYSTRRIRPRFYLYVIISIVNFIILFPLCYTYSGLDVILFTAGMYSVLKVLFEIIYYFDIKKSKNKNLFVDQLLAKASRSSDSSYGIMYIMLFLIASSHILSLSTNSPYLITLFVTSFLYRLFSRSYRFLWVDFLRLRGNNLIKQALLARSVAVLVFISIVSFVVCYIFEIKFDIVLCVLLLCLIEITLLRNRKLATAELIILTIFTLLTFAFRSVLFFEIISLFTISLFIYRNLKLDTGSERYITNYFLKKSKYLKYSFAISFYGSKVEFNQMIDSCHTKGHGIRRIGKSKFAVFQKSRKVSDSFKYDFFSAFSQNIKPCQLIVDDFLKHYNNDDYTIKRNVFGFWNQNLSLPEIRMLNFYSSRVIVSFSNNSKFKTFNFMEKKYRCSSSLGDKWLIS